jgi:hypothetical protein
MQDQSPYGATEKDLRELQEFNKVKQALKALGQYVDNACEDDGHNDEVVDKAYKLLQEVVAKWD